MDIATIAMKELKMKGMLDDLEESDEVNASSIVVNVDVDGKRGMACYVQKRDSQSSY